MWRFFGVEEASSLWRFGGEEEATCGAWGLKKLAACGALGVKKQLSSVRGEVDVQEELRSHCDRKTLNNMVTVYSLFYLIFIITKDGHVQHVRFEFVCYAMCTRAESY